MADAVYDLRDKVVLITGGARGIGMAIANSAAARGARIALVDLDEGVRMTTNIVHVSPEEVRCGQRVSVDWSIQLDDGRCLPTFAPTVR